MRPCRANFPRAAALALSLASPLQAAVPNSYPECSRTPTESEISAAKGAFEAGQVAFHEGDYDRAVLYWEDAFQRDCTAIALLLNLARAYELSRQNERSIGALEAYLERNPTTEDRPSIEKRIQRLSPKKSEPEPLAAAAAPEAQSGETAPTPAIADKPAAPAHKRPIWPVLVTGGGVVATGIGLGLTIAGQSSVDGYTSGLCSTQNESGAFECGPEFGNNPETGRPEMIRTAAEVEQDAQSALSQRNIGIVVTSIGAATAIGGAVAWWLIWRESPEHAALVPIVGKDTVGLVYSGAF